MAACFSGESWRAGPKPPPPPGSRETRGFVPHDLPLGGGGPSAWDGRPHVRRRGRASRARRKEAFSYEPAPCFLAVNEGRGARAHAGRAVADIDLQQAVRYQLVLIQRVRRVCADIFLCRERADQRSLEDACS
jgi:hypothetical protein